MTPPRATVGASTSSSPSTQAILIDYVTDVSDNLPPTVLHLPTRDIYSQATAIGNVRNFSGSELLTYKQLILRDIFYVISSNQVSRS